MTDAAGSAALASFDIRETSLCKSCALCGFLSNNFSDFPDNYSGPLGALQDRDGSSGRIGSTGRRFGIAAQSVFQAGFDE